MATKRSARLLIPLFECERIEPLPLELKGAQITSKVPVVGPVPDADCYLHIDERSAEEPRRTMDRALAVFRLFKEGAINSYLIFRDTSLISGSHLRDLLPHYTRWKAPGEEFQRYQLTRNEAEEFASFWERFIDVDPSLYPFSRFNLAEYRPYMKDRYVDYVSALEYLLVPDGRRGEIRYKFSTRGAHLLCDKRGPARRKIYERLRGAYDLRSEIVHGRDPGEKSKLPAREEWDAVLRELREWIRTLVRLLPLESLTDKDKRQNFILDRVVGGKDDIGSSNSYEARVCQGKVLPLGPGGAAFCL